MGLGTRLHAMLRALFGPEPAPPPPAEQDERRAFDDRLREQQAALEMLRAEAELAQRHGQWGRRREDVQGYGPWPGGDTP